MARDHLRVVRSPEDERAALMADLSTLGQRIEYRDVRAYHWNTPEGEALFQQITTLIHEHGQRITHIEEVLGMYGLMTAYLEWLGRQ